jgi:DNA invertase Pin-like site-specific DNA recombinase
MTMNATDRSGRTSLLNCAIYTRKSSEEGLEQEFNSLDAQREACEAYVRSQKHAGWQVLAEMYDDGGLSGGTMERPALQRLLSDVRAGKVQIVVVYKIDRLTRSLFDFAKIVETLDARGASFVSVTQQFNTTTSMGRLTLNVLLSFAQFEREITGERIRDKIAASKAKGMWMGGNVPLGYVVRERRLEIDPETAEKVRAIFRRYLALGSVALLKAERDRGGKMIAGRSLGRGALYHMLSNRIYRGEIVHKGRAFAGLHEAIIDAELWDAVRGRLETNRVERSLGTGAEHPSLLTGLIVDGEGRRMAPTHSVRRGLRYRYYASTESNGDETTANINPVRRLRIPAGDIEALVKDRLRSFLASRPELGDAVAPLGLDADVQQALLERAQQRAAAWQAMSVPELKAILQQLVGQVVVETNELALSIRRIGISNVLGLKVEENPRGQELNGEASAGPVTESLQLKISARLARRGKGVRLVIEGASTADVDLGLVKLLRESVALRDQLLFGSEDSIETMSKRLGLSKGHITSRIRLAWLAPNIVKSILDGSQPIGLGVTRLLAMSKDLPHDWTQQREMLGYQ